MSKRGWVIGIGIIVLTFLFLCLGSLALVLVVIGSSSGVPIGPKNNVAVIHIDGMIASSAESGLLSGGTTSSPENVIGALRQAENDSRVAAVVLRVNSPGGSAAASQEIYTEVKRMKKPVVVSVADIGASGAYYISSAADEIMASPASEVGSIGVILTVVNLEELYSKFGIKYVTIKQGKYKDIGSADRPMTDEEKKMLEEMTSDIYEQFISDVADARGLPKEQVRELATGMVWNGSQAKKLGLVDSLGNYRDAIKRAGKLGNIKGEPQVVTYGTPGLWDILTGVTTAARVTGLAELLKLLGGTSSSQNLATQ
ncbi:MAG: signal peptide peptidase SppA [Actinomycetota bacterium]